MSAPTTTKLKAADINTIGKPILANFKKVDTALTSIKSRGSSWHTDQHKTLSKQHTDLLERVKQLPNFIGEEKTNADLATLLKEVEAFFTAVKTALDTKIESTYYYGRTKVASSDALTAKVKDALPANSKGHASQAVNDAVNGTNLKDAAVAGKGVKHASAGKKGTSASATVFFTYDLDNDGLEKKLTIVAVGSHAGPSSYVIHDSSTAKLVQGTTYSL